MNYEIILEPSVEAEVEEIFRWIAEDSPVNAIGWYNGCIDAMHSLNTFPHRCPLAPEAEAFPEEIRQLLYGSYRILFAIAAQSVHVLHVRHGARRYLHTEGGPESNQ